MNTQEPLKADGNGPRWKGGHCLDGIARPGGKGGARRNHEAVFGAGNGRA